MARLIEHERRERNVEYAERTLRAVRMQHRGNPQAAPVAFWEKQVQQSRQALRDFLTSRTSQARLPL